MGGGVRDAGNSITGLIRFYLIPFSSQNQCDMEPLYTAVLDTCLSAGLNAINAVFSSKGLTHCDLW